MGKNSIIFLIVVVIVLLFPTEIYRLLLKIKEVESIKHVIYKLWANVCRLQFGFGEEKCWISRQEKYTEY